MFAPQVLPNATTVASIRTTSRSAVTVARARAVTDFSAKAHAARGQLAVK
jgi:hypothetical protein